MSKSELSLSASSASPGPRATPASPGLPPDLREAMRLHRSGDLQNAEAAYRRVLRADPDCIEALHGLGVVGLRLGKVDVALAFLGRAIQVAPAVGELYSAYGDAWLSANEPEQAVAALDRAAALRPGRQQAHAALGAALARAGRFENAVDSFRQALSLGSESADVYFQMAHALLRTRRGTGATDVGAAAAAAREAVRRRPEFAEAFHVLGEALGKLGKPAEAVASFKRAAELRPNVIAPWQGLGSALAMLGEFARAEHAFREALRLDPGCFEALRGLAVACARQQKLAEAIHWYEKAVSLRPDDAAARGDLARALENAGRRDEAVAHYEHLLGQRPGDAELQFHLAALTKRPAPPAAPAAAVASLFDRYAESFDEHLTATLDYRSPQLLFGAVKAAGLRQNARVMDLGCGTGLCGPLFRPIAAYLAGVDLSPGMIAKAKEAGHYDRLVVQDLLSALGDAKLLTSPLPIPHSAASPGTAAFDLLLAADVFVYLGDLAEVHKAAFAALQPGGLFAYSVEAFDGPAPYELRPTRRYAHSADYLAALVEDAGFERVSLARSPIRAEHGKDIEGLIVVLRRPSLASAPVSGMT